MATNSTTMPAIEIDSWPRRCHKREHLHEHGGDGNGDNDSNGGGDLDDDGNDDEYG